MNYRTLGTFSSASDALGCYATPTAGAAYWRGKVGIVRGVADPKNRLNPLMSVEFEWEIDGSRLPRKETWPVALMSLGLVKGFASQITKHEEAEGEALLKELGSIDIGNLEVSCTCERCGMSFDPDPENLDAKLCPDCRKDLQG